MSHVDEGLLHAYLDGAFASGDAQGVEIEAHLASCAGCRDRLEDARALKDRAREALHHATPIDVHVPPFEALRARKQAAPHAGAAHGATQESSSTHPRARSKVWLVWAASVVLAVGAGWMANELGRRDANEPPAAAVRLERLRLETKPQLTASRERQTGGEASEAAATPRSAQVDSPPPPAGAVAVTPTDTSDEAKPLVRTAEKLADRDTEREPVPAIANLLRRRAATQAQADRLAPVPEAARADAAGAEFRRTAFQPRDVIALDTLPPSLASGRAFVEHVALLNDYTAAVGGGLWSRTTAAQAAAALGRQPADIENLRPVETRTAVVNGRVLVLQRYLLEDGALLEVIQRPVAPQLAPASGEAFRERSAALPYAGIALKNLSESGLMFRGESALAANRPGLVLLLKGPVSQDYLHAIAARIR